MPRLRVLAGESPSSLKPIRANVRGGTTLKTSSFEGEISVFLKGFTNEAGEEMKGTEYFGSADRKGCTWSIQARGRFLKTLSVDNVLFGNVFDRPLELPYGSSAAIKFLHYADPTLEDDLWGEKPWALSPLITTVPHMSIRKGATEPSSKTSPIVTENASSILPSTAPPDSRRTHFRSPSARRDVSFTPEDYVELDFCQGLLAFEDGLSVSFPMVKFDLMQYWDGRPVWFACCERAGGEGGKGPGKMIWCVGFEILKDAGDEEEEADVDEKKEELPDISGDVD